GVSHQGAGQPAPRGTQKGPMPILEVRVSARAPSWERAGQRMAGRNSRRSAPARMTCSRQAADTDSGVLSASVWVLNATLREVPDGILAAERRMVQRSRRLPDRDSRTRNVRTPS